jgi:hypothetical protein
MFNFLSDVFFCQKLLSEEQFLNICSQTRLLEGFRPISRSPIGVFNRFVVSEKMRADYPEFSKYAKTTISSRILCPFGGEVQPGDSLRLIEWLQPKVAAGEIDQVWISVRVRVDGVDAEVTVILYGGIDVVIKSCADSVHPLAENSIKDEVERLINRLPGGFEARNARVLQELDFVPGSGSVLWRGDTASIRGDGVLDAFLKWWCARVQADGVTSFVFLKGFEESIYKEFPRRLSEWGFVNADLLYLYVRVHFYYAESVIDEARFYDCYTQWISRRIGDRTMSGLAPMFKLVGAPGIGDLLCWVLDRGFLVGFHPDVPSKKAPSFLEGVSDAGWLRGRIPVEDSNLADGFVEFAEPILGLRDEDNPVVQLKALLADTKAKKPMGKKKPAAKPGSVEHQLEVLAQAGIRLRPGVDAEDVVGDSSREVFEKRPFGEIFYGLGRTPEGGEPFADNLFWVDMGDAEYAELLAGLQRITGGVLPIENFRAEFDPEENGDEDWRIEFALAGEPIRWDLEDYGTGVDPQFLGKFNELLGSCGAGVRIYEVGDALASLSEAEAGKLREICSVRLQA